MRFPKDELNEEADFGKSQLVALGLVPVVKVCGMDEEHQRLLHMYYILHGQLVGW